MANLGLHQRVDWVISGKPWGDGASGAGTVNSDPNTRASFSGTSTQSTGTAGTTDFANGDLVLLHKTQSINSPGQWEFNQVLSGGGTTSLTFKKPLQYSYDAKSQIIKVPRYTTATVGAHSITAWNGTTGGVEVILARTSITVSGAVSGNGAGFLGGIAQGSGGSPQAKSGDGTVGVGQNARTANGNGGGGAIDGNGSTGAGGGNAAAGSNGGGQNGAPATSGGEAVGTADLTVMCLGGGGGGGRNDSQAGTYTGGNGAAILILISKAITLSTASTLAGANGNGTTAGSSGGGGGGAAGSGLLICDTATLGTNGITATGGSGGACSNGWSAGAGAVGRIAVHHRGTVTGTTNPSFESVTDLTLKELSGAVIFNYL